MKLILGGAMGRMGREVALAAKDAGMEIACGVDVAYSGQNFDFPVVTDFDKVTETADVLVDFSRPSGLMELLALAKRNKMPAVLCATGYTEEELEEIRKASLEIAVFRSANMSLGVNLLRRLCSIAARTLGEDFDIEIIERHHRMKADAPSGTALMLYDAVEKETGSLKEPIYGRNGRTAQRKPSEIGLHAVRGGTVTGEHEVCFYGEGEEVILSHRAENRSLFARGAVKAARFLKDKPAGMYDMQDVLDELLS
ncbi:MAG: 4-hydroxy-tetrahydrodipicolinate reductase [Clostridiales bacterium]|nr:4-hydroxy-tetrahydrodipicolinate reductase [Clostridiales bacterium]